MAIRRSGFLNGELLADGYESRRNTTARGKIVFLDANGAPLELPIFEDEPAVTEITGKAAWANRRYRKITQLQQFNGRRRPLSKAR